MHRKSPRRLPAVLLLALLAATLAPAGLTALPGTPTVDNPFEGAFSLLERLASWWEARWEVRGEAGAERGWDVLWGQEGCAMDPSGQPLCAPTPPPPEGCGMDPSGQPLCAPEPAPTP